MSEKTGQRPIMPRPSFPPTPAPSTDITGKSSANAANLEPGFALPPAAIASNRGSTSSSTASHASDSSYHPISPTSPSATMKASPATRKRSHANQSLITKDDYSLPPPPTRSRKIIQMKPKEQPQEPAKAQSLATTNAKATSAAGAGSKRKQAGNPTAAGRKIARKTAHSLIERRRRSKMNEEFGVLKDMIPACNGQEMHKLAILQASIEYLRYLESCVAGLKASHRSRFSPIPTSAKDDLPPPPIRRDSPEDDEDEGQDEDEEMSDAVSPTHVVNAVPQPTYRFTNASPAMYPSDRSVYSTTTSPNLLPGDHSTYMSPNLLPRDHVITMSPALQPSDPRHYSLASSIRSTATSPSIQASPAFGGQTPSQAQLAHFHNPFPAARSSRGSVSAHGGASFTLTSPALRPQADREDHEATEALMLIASADRRNTGGARGMSVRDLLSG